MSLIKGVEVQWAHIQQPDTRYDPVWKVDVVVNDEVMDNINKEIKEYAEKVGMTYKKFKAKLNDNDDKVITLKRNVNRSDGGENNAPVCVGTVKDELTGKLVAITELVGNGSICNVQYSLFKWGPNKFGSGISLDFKGLQVKSLVSYGAADGDEFDEEDEAEAPAHKLAKADEFDEEDFE